MAFVEFAPGSTSKSIYFLLRDAASAEGRPGLVAASTGAAAAYLRHQGAAVPITLSDLAAPDSVWSSGGFKEINASTMPGVYRLDVPDAALASGVPYVTFTLDFDATLIEGALVLLRSSVSNVGPGSIEFTVCVQDVSTNPIAGASVWVSTDVDGVNVIAGALPTNANGNVTFLLDAGDYFVWVQAERYSGTNPTAITVA